MIPIKLLITCVGGDLSCQTIAIIKQASKRKVRVIGVDNNKCPQAISFCDAFYPVPLGSSPDYIAEIKKICVKEGVDLIIPTSDEEALSLTNSRDVFESINTSIAAMDYELLSIFSNKIRTYEVLKSKNLPVADFKIACNESELQTAISFFDNQKIDFVIKPAISRGGRDVIVVENNNSSLRAVSGGREIHMGVAVFKSEILPNFKRNFPLIVMEKLYGPVHDIDMLAWKGRPIYAVPRKRVDSINPNAGHTLVNDPALIKIGEDIIKVFVLSWLYDCDIMFDRNGMPKIIEINPRQSGSIAVLATAGVPVFEDLISLFLKDEVEPVKVPYGKKVIPYKALAVVESEKENYNS